MPQFSFIFPPQKISPTTVDGRNPKQPPGMSKTFQNPVSTGIFSISTGERRISSINSTSRIWALFFFKALSVPFLSWRKWRSQRPGGMRWDETGSCPQGLFQRRTQGIQEQQQTYDIHYTLIYISIQYTQYPSQIRYPRRKIKVREIPMRVQ